MVKIFENKKGAIRNIPIEISLILFAIGTSLIGFIITIIGALLNGWAMFNNIKDLSEGFGLILIGDSIALLGVALIIPVFILSIFKEFNESIDYE